MNTRAHESSVSGQAIAAVGGAVLGYDLFQPWYSFRLPSSLLDSANQLAPHLGVLSGLVRSATAQLAATGSFPVSAWDSFSTDNVILLVIAIVAAGLAVLSLARRATRVGQLVALGGLAATALVAYRIVTPPGPALPGSGPILALESGAWVGLGASLVILAGGMIMSLGETRDRRRAATPTQSAWRPTPSSPPPQSGIRPVPPRGPMPGW